MSADIKVVGLEALRKHFAPGAVAIRMRRHGRRAMAKNVSLGAGAIKKSIASGQYAGNHKVTTSIKQSAKPLVATGALFKSIQGRVLKWDEGVVGVVKNRRVKDADGRSNDLLSIAAVLYFGATIKVTEKMRRFFAVMSRLYPGRYYPIRASTKVIVVPPRKFLDAALDDAVVKKYVDNWQKAVFLTIFKVKGGQRG